MGKILSRLVQSMDQRVGVKQDHRKGEPAQITKYHKIPKTLAPRLIFFKGPFWGLIFGVAYIWRGLSTEEIYRFCFVLLCIWEQFPSISPWGGGGGGAILILEEQLNRRFFVLWVWGAYNWRGLYMYVEGLIFRISRYMPTLPDMALISRVYLGVRTWELFLCFVPFVCVGFIVVDFFVFFVLRHG